MAHRKARAHGRRTPVDLDHAAGAGGLRDLGVRRRRRGAALQLGHLVPPQRVLDRAADARAPGASATTPAWWPTRWSTAPSAGRSSGRGSQATAAAIRTAAPLRRFHVRVAAHSAQTATVAAWKEQVNDLAARTADPTAARRATAEWWNAFWNRSWIFVERRAAGEAVTRAYVLQRWMTAAAGRGAYPIKFNGSIFTVEPEFTGGPKMNADWRRWGDCYWWQNTRLPYLPDDRARRLRPARAAVSHVPWPRRRWRAPARPAYFGADGISFPETMTIFGTWSNRDYGWDRKGHAAERGGERVRPPRLAAGPRAGDADARLLRAHAGRGVPAEAAAADGARRAPLLRDALPARLGGQARHPARLRRWRRIGTTS